VETKLAAKTLGRNLAKLRSKAGLTQESLAEQADISTRYVQDLEGGLYVPTVFIAERLRRALNCSWDDMLRGCVPSIPRKPGRSRQK
jgi:transcriptional regulator with XRE-family HTH domain